MRTFLQNCLPIFAVVLTGCSTIINGGAPPQTTRIEDDLKAIEKHLAGAASIDEFYKNPSESARNQFISARLVSMNIRYLEFVRTTTSERQAIDAASDILVLSLGLAGATFNAAGTKTVLAAVSSGISGGATALNKHYFFEKTIPALVATMNAKRLEAMIPILQGRGKLLSEYSLEQAITDLNQYYQAGTFLGALQAIHNDAGARQVEANAVIATLTEIPDDLIKRKADMIAAINSLQAANLDVAKAAVAKLLPTDTPGKTLAELQGQLRRAVRSTHTDKDAILRVEQGMKETGILKNP